jgi:hypothetical protein
MNRLRRLALAFAVVAVAGFGIGPVVGDAEADHKWKHRGHKHGPKWRNERVYRDHDRRDRRDFGRYDRRDRYRHDHDRDRRDYRRPSRDYGRSSYDSAKCAEVARRIDRAHYEINKWEGTGRHKGVVSWYKGDLQNAMRDRARYCGGRASGGDWRRGYDRYDRYGRFDSDYDYDDRRDFDVGRDWPALLGLFMNGGVATGY